MHVHPRDRMNEDNPRSRRRNDSRNTFRTILILAILIAVIFLILMIVYIVRQNSPSQTTVTNENSEEKKVDDDKIIFNNCIDFLLEKLLQFNFNQSNSEQLQRIYVKVFITLRYLNPIYKRDLILFLYEKGLIRTDIPSKQRLHLYDINLNNVEFKNVDLDYLYLPRINAINILFYHCQLKYSNFQGSIIDKSRFIGCSLDNSIFQDTSLNYTSFKDGNTLSNIDFTNADLFGSDINMTGIKNNSNARFPDGSFQNIESKELVKDGEAESQCNATQNDHWKAETDYSPFTTIQYGKERCIRASSTRENNCYFRSNSNQRSIQSIDLNRYSTLIDNNQAWYNISAYMGCNTTSTVSPIVELYLKNKKKPYEEPLKYELTRKSVGVAWNSALIPIGTRTVKIVLGTNKLHFTGCCAIDDIKFKIFQHIGSNATYL